MRTSVMSSRITRIQNACMHLRCARAAAHAPVKALVSLLRFLVLLRDSFLVGGMRKSVMSSMSKGMQTTMFHEYRTHVCNFAAHGRRLSSQ